MENPLQYLGTSRKPWKAAQNAGQLDRQTHAAEYVAMYLDRIDLHLERIATALEGGRISDALRLQLMNIEHAIRGKLHPD